MTERSVVESSGTRAQSETTPPSILFITRSLNRGGAERQLLTLAVGLSNIGWHVSIACFYSDGALEKELEGTAVRLVDIRKSGRWDFVGFVYRLRRKIREIAPDVLHSYLTVSNLVLAFLRMLGVHEPIIWGIRSSRMDLDSFDRLSRLTGRLEARLAFCADLIIANSQAGRSNCLTRGFPAEKLVVISNGVDTDKFVRNTKYGYSFRREIGVSEKTILVGLVSRVDPMKDHHNFIQAAALLAASSDHWRFVCVGDYSSELGESMRALASNMDLDRRLVWTGERSDLVAVYSGLDILASTSLGEGFSNSISEAMACGCPCVVTDVGDSALIVGECGEVMKRSRPSETAASIERMWLRLNEQGEALRKECRRRIVKEFGVSSLVDKSARAISKTISK